ncbi:MAG: preprotein translocase subunit SecY [Ruminococcus flavefaciens]|nr:preprotein translocase subunit SecY [Ruminococcus flavefaciens]
MGRFRAGSTEPVKENVLKYKLLYTAIIILIYTLGKRISLYGIDVSGYDGSVNMNVEDLLMQTINGDAYRSSIFALGIFPSMIAGFSIQILMAIRGLFTKTGVSPGKSRRMTLAVTVMIAVFQAVVQAPELNYKAGAYPPQVNWTIAGLEMVTGAVVIMWMADGNGKYGLGGRMAFMIVNILERIARPIATNSLGSLKVPLAAGAVMMVIALLMENIEKRIPVQRISIHNIYADKNYMAIKLNPVGLMPLMFTTAVFMLPKLTVTLLVRLFPYHQGVLWWQENLTLMKPLGIFIYLVCEYLLTIGLAMLMISPKDISENFLKSGDSIVNLHAGRPTRRYLRRVMWGLSLLSATVMGGCICVPILLQRFWGIDSTLAALPTSIMMLTGFSCNIYREVRTLWAYDSCRPLF